MSKKRAAGILMHISSLSSPFGIGDLGNEAYAFADFLNRANQKYWQILPVTPIDAAQSFSPYSSVSGLAGNVWLISPEKLYEEGYLKKVDLHVPAPINPERVNYQKAIQIKSKLLVSAYKNSGSQRKAAFEAFCDREAYWLDDFSIYMALKSAYKNKPWYEWPEDFKLRDLKSLLKFSAENQKEIIYLKWLQFTFFHQWKNLKRYSNDLNVQIIGDLPFYVSYDSVDVWSRQEIFNLNKNGSMAGVAGVPPDYFNEDGQLWGMPVYRWDVLKDQGYDWWIKRIRKNMELVDLLRLDHFRAFADYWEVPAKEKTAVRGEWKQGPGEHFFSILKQEFGKLPFIAEDLGDISDIVYKLRDQFHLPGMKVLQFAFGDEMGQSDHIPHNYKPNFFAYTGTHDNNTTLGWYRKELKEKIRDQIRAYSNASVSDKNIHEILIRMIYASVAKVAIIPMQDILGLDENSRMNVPASTTKNWQWRLNPEISLPEKEKWLRQLTALYARH
jgi:4-alpha-glucanotransferase